MYRLNLSKPSSQESRGSNHGSVNTTVGRHGLTGPRSTEERQRSRPDRDSGRGQAKPLHCNRVSDCLRASVCSPEALPDSGYGEQWSCDAAYQRLPTVVMGVTGADTAHRNAHHRRKSTRQRGTATADTVLLPHLRVRPGVVGLTGSAYAQHDPAALPATYCEGRSPRDSTSLGASRRSSMLPHLRVRPVGLCTRSTCLRAGL